MKTCVLVADRARARLFVDVPGPERIGVAGGGSELFEVEALTDPDGELTDRELFSNRSGSNRSPHGAQFAYDDHREGHREEEERRFARRVASSVVARVRAEQPAKLILAVEPRLLGLLRQELNGHLRGLLEVVEVSKDLSWPHVRLVREALVRCGAINVACPA